MRNLLDFIIRNYFFFLFAILETIAITMFIQNNYFQRSGIINSTLELSGFFYQKYDNIAQYFSLKEANRKLMEENAKLRSKQSNSFMATDNKMFYKNDTLYRQQYQYFGAKVINNSINKKNNYLTLDKGAIQGVKKEMAVVSTTGIVGIVKDVSPNFSSVISILHKDSRISSKHKKSGQIGTVVWEENDYHYGYMKDVPTHVKINVGDSIITSEFSGIFPEGILIGKIADYTVIKSANFYNIKVRFATDFNSLTHVYVITNLMKEEIKKLEEKSQNE